MFILAELFFFCFAWSDLEPGSKPAVLSQLLQDEDVSHYRRHPHEFRSGAQCLQLPVGHLDPDMLNEIYGNDGGWMER